MDGVIGEALKLIGFLTICVGSGFVFVVIYGGVCRLIDKLKYNYHIKHRFDKPPTAKCYCIDCKRHDNDTKRCYRFEYKSGYQCTADNWFCWEAEPRDKEETK